MKNLKKWYINLSIQRKILYCTLGVALVVLLAASVSQYMSASSIVTEQTRKQSAGVVNELSVNLDHYFDMVRNSFEYIANNNTVQEELESDEPYKSDGTELYSYYSRSGQIRRLLLQGYTSIYILNFQPGIALKASRAGNLHVIGTLNLCFSHTHIMFFRKFKSCL